MRSRLAWGLVVVAATTGCRSGGGPEPDALAPTGAERGVRISELPSTTSAVAPGSDGANSFTILAVNDVYRISGLLPSERGGLARLRTLRRELERDGDVLFLHGGDALFPSMLSREYDGAHMVDVLNLLDGDEYSFDPYMAVVFGNHEFDKDEDGDRSLFEARMRESDFTWLGANVSFPARTTGDDRGEGKTRGVDLSSLGGVIQDGLLLDRGGIRVGVFGLTMGKDPVAYADFANSESELLRHANEMTTSLADRGADVIVALTHLRLAEDVMLAEQADEGLDLIIGGHEHHQVDTTVNGRQILKADADATTASVITVTNGSDGVTIEARYETLGAGTYRADPDVHARAEAWQARFERSFCRDEIKKRYCLDEVIGAVGRGGAVAEELRIRSEGTNVGRTYTRLMLEAGEQFRATGPPQLSPSLPMVAIMNSGALRLNQTLDEGDRWLLRHTEELVQYPEDLWVLGFDVASFRAALNRSVTEINEGPWLQVAGVEFTADVASKTAKDIKVGGIPLDQIGDSLLVVTGGFLAGKEGDGKRDGYPFTETQNLVMVVDSGREPVQAKNLFRSWLQRQGSTITFDTIRRIRVVR